MREPTEKQSKPIMRFMPRSPLNYNTAMDPDQLIEGTSKFTKGSC